MTSEQELRDHRRAALERHLRKELEGEVSFDAASHEQN